MQHFSLHNNRIVASLGLDKLSLVAFGVVVGTGSGPNLARRNALAPDWLRQVVTSKEEEQVRLRDANNARLRTSGTVMLWLQTRSCHGYIPEEYIRALYPYPLRIRTGDAYSKTILRKRGEDISIPSHRNREIISGPYPRY